MQRPQRDIATADLIESMLPGLLVLICSAGLAWLLAWVWVWVHALRRSPDWSGPLLMVCGHQLVEGQPSPDYRARLAAAADRLAADPALELLLLGGGEPSEAGAGRDWLVAHRDVDPSRIALEEESVDSLENLYLARALIADRSNPGLLSSRYHLGRLAVLARQAGLDVCLLPAEPRPAVDAAQIRRTAMEAIYLIWFLCGRFWARLARRPRLLAQLGE